MLQAKPGLNWALLSKWMLSKATPDRMGPECMRKLLHHTTAINNKHAGRKATDLRDQPIHMIRKQSSESPPFHTNLSKRLYSKMYSIKYYDRQKSRSNSMYSFKSTPFKKIAGSPSILLFVTLGKLTGQRWVRAIQQRDSPGRIPSWASRGTLLYIRLQRGISPLRHHPSYDLESL